MSVKAPSRVSIVAASSGLVRWETFNGREHLVVPIVTMIGDEVFHPMGSKGPAFVPADVLAAWPSIWNDTIIMLDHPEGATAVSTPDYIEGFGLGRIYNARFENNALQMEEWLDPDRHTEGEALKQFEALKAGKKIEVSFAPYVVDEYAPGISEAGKPYEYIWRLIVGCDHVANLPSGVLGACSNEMGCGAPMAANDARTRAASEAKKPHASENNPKNHKEASMPSKFSMSTVFAKVKNLLQVPSVLSSAETEVGDLALWSKMWEILESTEPAFNKIEDIFHDSMRVVYSVRVPPFDTWDPVVALFSRPFAVDENGAITLTGEREAVALAPRTYVPVEVSNQEAIIEAAATCGCKKVETANQTAQTETNGAGITARMEESTMTDEEIKSLVTQSVQTAVDGAVKAATTDLLTKADIAPLLAAAQAQEAASATRKAELVSELVSACQTPGMPTFTEDDLKALELPILEKMAASFLAPVVASSVAVNYAALGMPRKPIAATSTAKKSLPPLPDPHGVNKFLIPAESTSETEN